MQIKKQISFIRKTLHWIILLVIFLATFGVEDLPFARAQSSQNATPTDAQVSLSMDKSSFVASENVILHVTITNPLDHAIRILKWFTPIEGVKEPLFVITRDGKPVPYLGMFVKRAAPTEVNYFTLKAGESLIYDVDLATYYDFSVSGNYTVTYNTASMNMYADGSAGNLLLHTGSLISNTFETFIEGRLTPVPDALKVLTISGANAYSGCSISQQTSLVDARNSASTYAKNAVTYFSANKQGARYTTWFGAYDASRYGAVSTHFGNISYVLDNASPMTFDCTCTDANIYAYVYPNLPYTLYLCGAFWGAPATGTDSKAGTLIHETSHFTVVAGTQDYAYGQTGAKNLAISNPAKAIMNADSHEYFAENTPPLDLPTISGKVEVPGATLSYTDGIPKTVFSQADGSYSISVPNGWSGTVTPSSPGVTFTPINRTYSNVLSDQIAQDYVATVTLSGNAGLAGVTMSYMDGILKNTITDGGGNYSILVPFGWSGTVAPYKAGYVFAPASRPYTNVVTNQPAQDYTTSTSTNSLQDPSFEAGIPNPYWIEASTNFPTPLCTVMDCGVGGLPRTGSVWGWLGGTTLDETSVLSQTIIFPNGTAKLNFYLWIGSAGVGSDAADVFTAVIDGVPVFSANATQISSYSTYTLVSVNVNSYADGAMHTVSFSSVTTGQEVDFHLDDVTLESPPRVYTITGNTGAAGVTLTYNDGAPKTVTSDGSGNYSINIQSGWSGAVTPSKSGHTFTPTSRTYFNVQSNKTNQNYCADCADATGVFRPSNGLLYLKNHNTTGFADVAINYGMGGDYPVVGDWDGNGTATIGIYRNGSFYLRNSNTLGFADLVFAFGQPGDQPIAGDWNGDGIDTIGIYRPSTGQFLLRNSNTKGAADMSFYLGNVGDVGIAGDWNGDGKDTTGVFRPSNGVIFLKNTNATGFADIALNYGNPGDQPVTGDWNGDGMDTIGVYRNGQFLLRNSNTIGFANIVFGLGNPGDMPIAGNWDGLP
jgi:peptidyl-Lys metalloendopeptidase